MHGHSQIKLSGLLKIAGLHLQNKRLVLPSENVPSNISASHGRLTCRLPAPQAVRLTVTPQNGFSQNIQQQRDRKMCWEIDFNLQHIGEEMSYEHHH